MARRPRFYTAADGVAEPELLQFGLDHISAAQALFEGSPSHFDSAGYIAHLGLELLLKAWHLHTTGRFPAIHSLKILWKGLPRCSELHPLSRYNLKTLCILDGYAELRYPNLNNPVEIGSDDLPMIVDLMQAIFKCMPTKLKTIAGTRDWSMKGGRMLMEKPITSKDGA